MSRKRKMSRIRKVSKKVRAVRKRTRRKVNQPNRLLVRHDPLTLTQRGKYLRSDWIMAFRTDAFLKAYNPDHVFEILADALQTAYEEVIER